MKTSKWYETFGRTCNHETIAQWEIALGEGRLQLERPLQALKLIIIAY